MANELNINIGEGDAWKEVDSVKINIGDSWKEASEIQVNIGDTWKVAWKRKAAYFKVRYRAKRDAVGVTLQCGVILGDNSVYNDVIVLTTSFADYETGNLVINNTSYTETECASLQVKYTHGTPGGWGYISEIEVDIYDDSDHLLDTVKPNSDESIEWTSTEGTNYGAVNNGISTPNDTTYVSNNTAWNEDQLGLENPSW